MCHCFEIKEIRHLLKQANNDVFVDTNNHLVHIEDKEELAIVHIHHPTQRWSKIMCQSLDELQNSLIKNEGDDVLAGYALAYQAGTHLQSCSYYQPESSNQETEDEDEEKEDIDSCVFGLKDEVRPVPCQCISQEPWKPYSNLDSMNTYELSWIVHWEPLTKLKFRLNIE